MSVRGERVVYRERDTERDEAPRTKYTTVKRYQVPEAIQRSSVYRGEEEVKEDKIIIRRERKDASPQPPPREEVEYRFTERTRERERERPREDDYTFTERIIERDRSPRQDVTYRVVERDRESDHEHYSSRQSLAPPRSEYRSVRAPSPPSPERERVREFRFERERDFSPARSHRERDERPYDVERYSKSTEYYAQPQPQPIIIREAAPQPIIIREERREPREVIITRREEPRFEFIEREEVKEQSLVKREEPPPSEHPPSAPSHVSEKKEEPEEDYFYERRVIERSREPREPRYDDVRPKDSASQYSSDESYEYVRRERTTEGSRDRGSPHHKRHLAEGALAGIAAGELIRHHRKSQGEQAPGRGRTIVGGAALGAVGAEALSRVRSFRRGSESRSRSDSRDRRRGGRRDDRKKKDRSRSRSKSLSRAQQLGGLAAIAAVGALAGYAIKKSGQNKETVVINERRPRRSRSRRRRASVDSYALDEVKAQDQALNPGHRNRRIAQAGLASAAAAGIWERMRSKSRKGGERSRVRQGVPIAAAGLGGAALAGLYEKNKAGKEAKKEAIIEDELARGRRRRSRSRSRSAPAPYPYSDEDSRSVDDRGMVAYGNGPISPDSQRGYYSDEEPGNYRRRHHGGSDSGSSPDTRRRNQSRSRSRGTDSRRLAEGGAAAGGAAVGAHDEGRRRDRSEQRQGYGEGEGPYAYQNAGYGQEPPYGYGNNDQQYSGGPYFPPPPTGEHARAEPDAEQQAPYPVYNPADYAQGGHQTSPYGQQPYTGYGNPEATSGAPYPNDLYGAGDQRYGGGHDTPGGGERRGRDPENMV